MPAQADTKKKIGLAQKGKKNHRFGKKQSEKLNKEHSARISGEGNSMYGKKSAMLGKTHSLEAREKISRAKKEWWRKKKNEIINTDDCV